MPLLIVYFSFLCSERSFYFSSDIRSFYKDLVWLMNKNSLIESDVLKNKVSIMPHLLWLLTCCVIMHSLHGLHKMIAIMWSHVFPFVCFMCKHA